MVSDFRKNFERLMPPRTEKAQDKDALWITIPQILRYSRARESKGWPEWMVEENLMDSCTDPRFDRWCDAKGLRKHTIGQSEDSDTFLKTPLRWVVCGEDDMGKPDSELLFIQHYLRVEEDWAEVECYHTRAGAFDVWGKISTRTVRLEKGDSSASYHSSDGGNSWERRARSGGDWPQRADAEEMARLIYDSDDLSLVGDI